MQKEKEKLVKVEVTAPEVIHERKPLKKGDSMEVTEAMANILVHHGFKKEGDE